MLFRSDLAGRLSCSLSTVQKLEEGERRPSKALATNLLEALEIPEGEHAVFMRLARGKPAPRTVSREASRDEARAHDAQYDAATPPNNIPFPINALIGRETETAWVQDLLAGDDARLVTLTGLPGVGKTRLAQHIAHDAQFEDGVCYVSFAALPHQVDPQLACNMLAAAIGNTLHQRATSPEAAPLAQTPDTPNLVIAYLREMDVLLVLDNIEPVLASRDFLVRLLQETRWVKLLITSHERLRLRAEHVMQLAGLSIQADDADSPALQLFMARTSRVAGPSFTETHATEKMARICQQVDGLPLGIEMACELTATHTLDEIGDAIARDIAVLHTTSPDVPEAHRSLCSLLTTLWQRLSPEEQHVTRQCARFEGSFRFEEVSRTLQLNDLDSVSLRARFNGLIEKSVLRRTMDEANRAGGGLYLLHPLLKQFIAQTLAKH